MSFRRFLLSQVILFVLSAISSSISGGNNIISNLLMNFITFFTAGFIIVFMVDSKAPLYATVLSSTLSFNAVTYILVYYSGIPIPNLYQLVLDFIIVTFFTCAGIRAGISKKTIS